MADFPNVEFARKNEQFADDILVEFADLPKNNWVVTVRFYSLLHFVEHRLRDYDYDSTSHKDRKSNILRCSHIDDQVRNYYRLLEDISRDARYECLRMTEEDLEKAEEALEDGKQALGFHNGSATAKYSTS